MAMQRAPSFPSEYTTACESRRGISGRVWLLASGGHGRLKEIFQSMSEAAERPQALLSENSGASHGQKSRSIGQLRRDETVRSGTEKRRGWKCPQSGAKKLEIHFSILPGHKDYLLLKTLKSE